MCDRIFSDGQKQRKYNIVIPANSLRKLSAIQQNLAGSGWADSCLLGGFVFIFILPGKLHKIGNIRCGNDSNFKEVHL